MAASTIERHGEHDVAGVILGHGRTIPEELVVIPEGIQLRPLSKLSCDLLLGKGAPTLDIEQMDIMSTKDMRSMTWDQPDEMMAHIYKPGDVIYNMAIHFRVTWDENEPDKKPRYYTTGIVTGGRIKKKIQIAEGPGNNRELTRGEIADALSGHNTDVLTNIWDRRMHLGDVLNLVANYRRRKIGERTSGTVEESDQIDRYYILSCRGLGGVDGAIEAIDCFPEKQAVSSGKLVRQLSDDRILLSFADDMEFIRDTIGGLDRPSADLIETYDRVRLSLEYNNTITKDDFCQIKRYVDLFKQIIPSVPIPHLRDIGTGRLYEKNRIRLCNMIDLFDVIRQYKFNITLELAELIRQNTPQTNDGEPITITWINYFDELDSANYDKKIREMEQRVKAYTQKLGDVFTCDQTGGGLNYYHRYVMNRNAYLKLR